VGLQFSVFFFSSRRRHTRLVSDWSSDVCSSDLYTISSEGGVTTIACPPRRNWLILLFLIAWLGGWTVGGMGAFTQVTKPGDHQEIGRASCRERGEMSRGGGEVEKKNE